LHPDKLVHIVSHSKIKAQHPPCVILMEIDAKT